MVREIWRETDRIKAGKNFKVTEPKFSNVTALNGLAKFYCIIVSADRTLQIYATTCIFQIRPNKKIPVFPVTRPTLIFFADPNLFLQVVELSAIFGSARPLWREILWREISRYLQAIGAVQFRYIDIPQKVLFN